MTVSADEFKNALRLWASGVTVVTTQSEQYGVQGMTVSAFSSVSVDPPLVLVCINTRADTGDGLFASGSFAVNVLNSTQQHTSNQFAGGSSQEQRFLDNAWSTLKTGAPILNDSLMSLDCTVVEKVQAGTHWVVIGEVQTSVCRDGEPLLYYSGSYRELS